MDEKKFPNGRHRDKTYLQVYQNDEEFCNMVLHGEKSRFIPDDFLQYLKSKNMQPRNNEGNVHAKKRAATVIAGKYIEERTTEHFVNALDDEMRAKFLKIIYQRGNEIRRKQVHRRDYLKPHNFFGIFYKLFIQKHIGNVANANCYSHFLNINASIFPFPVSDKLSIADFEDSGILAVITNDETFKKQMQMFLNKHFGQVDLFSIMETFFANVLNCKANVVDEPTVWKVLQNANLTEKLTEAKNISCEKAKVRGERRNEYLANFPRLGFKGVEKFRALYRRFKIICELYEKPCEISSDKYEENYLRNLPEINFYELYSLLDVEIFNGQPSLYLSRLQKYLFFFVNALNNEVKPVFFIDDMLFESLLHYTTLRKPCRSVDVLDLKYELSVLSLIYLRKFRTYLGQKRFAPHEENLLLVKSHVDSFSDLKGVSVGRNIRTELLDSPDVKVCTNEMVMDIRYKQKSRDNIDDFFELVIQGALMNENIQRLVIYNAYLGEETSIKMPDKQEVVEFIRSHSRYYDLSKESAPEKYFTWGIENFYEGDVANWNPKFWFSNCRELSA